MPTKRIHLIRHGATATRYQGRYIGSTDVSLSPEGRQQAFELACFVDRCSGHVLLSSPLQRCRESATLACASQVDTLLIDRGLREVDFGRWEGMTFAEIQRQFPQEVIAWAELRPEFTFPGGDNLGAFMERMQRVKQKLCSMPDRAILLFTHGGVIRFLLCLFLGRPLQDYLSFQIPPASVTTLVYEEGHATLGGVIHKTRVAEVKG